MYECIYEKSAKVIKIELNCICQLFPIRFVSRWKPFYTFMLLLLRLFVKEWETRNIGAILSHYLTRIASCPFIIIIFYLKSPILFILRNYLQKETGKRMSENIWFYTNETPPFFSNFNTFSSKILLKNKNI